MRYIVDRIEGSFAVLQDDNETLTTHPLSALPAGVRPGDVLLLENGAYTVDSEATKSCRSRILALQNKIRRKN